MWPLLKIKLTELSGNLNYNKTYSEFVNSKLFYSVVVSMLFKSYSSM